MRKLIVLVLLISSCFAMPRANVEAGYFGNGNFGEEGNGSFTLDARFFFKGKNDGFFVNFNPILFASGRTFATDNDLPTSFSSIQFGSGYQKNLGDKFFAGVSCGLGFGSGTYPTQDSVVGISFSSSENRSAMVTSYGCFMGISTSKDKNIGFSSKVGLKGLIIDSQAVMGIEISAGVRIGK